jgi:hypothetical protein
MMYASAQDKEKENTKPAPLPAQYKRWDSDDDDGMVVEV